MPFSVNQAVVTPVLKADLTIRTYSYCKSTNRFTFFMISSSLSRRKENPVSLFKDIWKALQLLCQKYILETLLCSDKRILGYELSALSLRWQVWINASWEMQHKAPAQMHFIIITITEESSEAWDFCFVGDVYVFFFPPSMFPVHYFSNAWRRIWKKLWEQIHCFHGSLYCDGFNDSIKQVCTSIKLPGAAKETNHWPAPHQATGLLVVPLFRGCSCQVYHTAIKRPWQI